MPEQYQDPIQTIVQGMLQGHQIASQLKFQKLQEEAALRTAERQDREMGIQDIMTRIQLEQHGRPVTAGTVSDPYDYDLPDPSVPNARMTGSGSISRPADKTRIAKHKTRDGQTLEYELYTPKEQKQRQVELAREGKVPVQVNGTTAWVEPEKVPTLQKTMLENEMVDTPADYQGMGGQAQLPRGMQTQVMNVLSQMFNRQDANNRTADTIAGAQQRQDDQQAFTAGENEKNRKSREKAAGTRAAVQASTQAGIEARQDKRDDRRDERQERSFIEREHEPTLHARRRGIGDMLKRGTDEKAVELTAGHRGLLQAEYQAVTDELQGLQLRKAKLYGIKTPPPDVIKKIKEGTEGPGPDGRIWAKKDGVLYVVR